MAINLKTLSPAPSALANTYLFTESLEVVASTPYTLANSTVDLLAGKDSLTTTISVPALIPPAATSTPVTGLFIQAGARLLMGLDNDVVSVTILGGADSDGTIGFNNNGSFYADSLATGSGGTDKLVVDVVSDVAIGIRNTGLIDMGFGIDSILTTAGNNPADLGGAFDLFTAANCYGVYNTGTILMGAGNDRFRADAVGATSFGLYNGGSGTGGVIDLGAGADSLTVSVENVKVDPASGGGTGNYALYNDLGRSINTGLGADRISAISISAGGYGIYNLGTIDTTKAADNTQNTDDNGKDVITGDSVSGLSALPVEAYVGGGTGIFNSGIIRTGGGTDVVDAISGGFGGNGQVFLGAGKDSLLGFGAGSFYGEADIDNITLSPGSYSLTYAPFTPANPRPTRATSSVNATITEAAAPGVEMKIFGFEGIGGSGNLAGLHFVNDLAPTQLLRSFTITTNPLTGLGDVSAVVYAV